MGPILKFIILLVLFAIHLPSPVESKTRNVRYLYHYKYRGYYSSTSYNSRSSTNGTECGSSCIAGSVFTTLATQPCFICCFIVVAYFMCKCGCAACNGFCKSYPNRRGSDADQIPVIQPCRNRSREHRRDGTMNEVIMLARVEDTPPPYSPDMEKRGNESEKVAEEKPPEYQDVYAGEDYPVEQ